MGILGSLSFSNLLSKILNQEDLSLIGAVLAVYASCPWELTRAYFK